jgi:hypothetical protein
MRGVEGYEALVVGARERKEEGRPSSTAGTKFSWPENARESISARVGGDAILFAVRQSVQRGLLTADIACRRSFEIEYMNKGLRSQKRPGGMTTFGRQEIWERNRFERAFYPEIF